MSQDGSKEDSGSIPPSPDSFQPQKQSKIVRILTVIAYMLSVSIVAIFLSAYYIFMYDAQPTLAQKSYPSNPYALTQIPNFQQYEHYVTFKENRILKDKGLLQSKLIDKIEKQYQTSSTENDTEWSNIDQNDLLSENYTSNDTKSATDNTNELKTTETSGILTKSLQNFNIQSKFEKLLQNLNFKSNKTSTHNKTTTDSITATSISKIPKLENENLKNRNLPSTTVIMMTTIEENVLNETIINEG